MNDDRPSLHLRRYERLAVRQRRLRLSAGDIAARTSEDGKPPLAAKYVQDLLAGRVQLSEDSQSNGYARIDRALASFERGETVDLTKAAA